MEQEHQYEGYSPQVPDEWPNNDMSQLQHDPTSSSVSIPSPVPDQASDDLAYKPMRRNNTSNNPPPNGWLYPHKKGIGTGSNLEPFKAEIEARTHRGENCKAIAAALNAMGVQTSDRAVSRLRIRWGMRKRAQRKVKTPPPDAQSVPRNAKSRVQAMRKAELMRMTQEGMSPEEIYQSLTTRGMELKKGVATVLRLQSAWGVARDEKRWLGNFRHQCHKKAKAQQAAAFADIAKELGVQDIKGWIQAKMKELPARQARHELALKLMGEHAPTNPERRKLQRPRRANGPGAELAQENDAGVDSDSASSDDEEGYESDFGSPATTHQKFELIDSAHQGGHIPGSDGQVPLLLPHDGDGGAQLATCPATAPGDSPNAADIYAEAGDYPAYPLSHDPPDGTMRGSGQGQHDMHPMPSNQMLVPAPLPPNPPGPGGKHSLHVTSSSSSAPVPKPTGSITSGLVLPPEEAEANKSTLSTLDQYNDAARVYKELLEARNNNRPLPGSLTGMPPSAKEVDAAKRKLKEATQAMMLALD